MNEEVEVVLQKDAYFAEWSVWSPCSTCSDKNFEKFGIKTRSASCIEGEKIHLEWLSSVPNLPNYR